MAITNKQRDKINKMNRASQDVSLGTIVQQLQNTSGSNALAKSGDVMTGNLGFQNAGIASASYIGYNTSYVSTGSEVAGISYWDATNHTVSTVLENGIVLQNGQEIHIYGKNNSGSMIHNGEAVSVVQASGQWTAFAKTSASNVGSAYAFVGLATQDIADNNFGYVTMIGQVRDISTTGLTEGKAVYVDPAIPGHLTSTYPSVPNYVINVGVVERTHASQGRINVVRSVVPKIQDLSDVNGTPLNTAGQILVWNTSGSYFDPSDNINNYVKISHRKRNSKIITGSYILTTNDDLVITNTSASVLVQLPSATGGNDTWTVSNIGTGACVISASASNFINGETSQTIYQYESVDITDYVLNNWIIT